MKIANLLTYSMRLILLIALLVTLLGIIVACEDLGLSPSENSEPESDEGTGLTIVNTKDAAILTVYRHLLAKAGSADAKTYLSDFYTACDNWDTEAEYFKDGSDVWHVTVDMTGELSWNLRSYWQQASWFILDNGEVIPSNLFEANALRIEADLQELSDVTVSDSD